MADFILRDVDDDVWARVKAKAKSEGRTLRGLLLWLLMQYLDGKIK